MFEVGFTELLLIFALALVVLGPRRLPELASRVGRWVGRARAMARQLREQLDQEVSLEDAETRRQATPPAFPMPDMDLDPHGKPYYPADHHANGASESGSAQDAGAATEVPESTASGIEPEPAPEPSNEQRIAHERRGS